MKKNKQVYKQIPNLKRDLKELNETNQLVIEFWTKKMEIYNSVRFGLAKLKYLEEYISHSNSECIDKTIIDMNARAQVITEVIETLLFPSKILEDEKKKKFAEKGEI